MSEQLSLRLPADLARAIRKLARERGVPRAAVVREALEAYLASPAVDRSKAAERLAPYLGSVELDYEAIRNDPIADQIYRHNWRA
jgi:metal-responsive CopG/Arc/MetJ family transcriptional regulator